MTETTPGRLHDLTAVVTGAGRGVGRAIARRFAAEGARVVVAARSDAQIAQVVDEIRATGGAALSVQVDITDDAAVAALAARTADAYGPADILVNNAGIHVVGRFEDLSLETWQRVVEVNLYGTVRVTRAFLDQMLSRETGRIINVASTAGKYGSLFQSPYNASKHAVVGLTRCLALETAQRGVRVNAICPGFVQTDLIDSAQRDLGDLLGMPPGDVPDALLQRVPIRRFLEPDEIAELATYLASPAADGMTGQALTLSGGLILV